MWALWWDNAHNTGAEPWNHGVISGLLPPETAFTWLTSLCWPCCQHTCRLRKGGDRKCVEDEACMFLTDRVEVGGTSLKLSLGSCDQIETLKRPFEDLHFGSSLQCVEHSDNLFKEKQITSEVKELHGTLVKTLYVSLHCSLSSLFEDRFLYNNILNQSLNSLSSRSSLLLVDWAEMT